MKTRNMLLGCLLAAAFVQGQENYALWTGQQDFLMNTTGSGAGVSADVRDFPVLVRLSAANAAIFAAAKAGGADIRFSKSNGTHLPFQIEQWDSAAGSAAIWVKVDTVRGNAATQIVRMHWGKPDAADSSNGSAVFDTSKGYAAVWHMSNTVTTGPETDATGNGFNAVVNTSVYTGNSPQSTTTAIIGRARSFGGGAGQTNSSNRDFLVVQNSKTGRLNFSVNSRYSISAWVRAASVTGNRGIVSKTDRKYNLKVTNSGNFWESTEYNDNFGTLVTHDTVAPYNWESAQAPASTNTWTYLVGVHDSLRQKIYVNGALIADKAGTDTASYGSTAGQTNPPIEDSALYIGKQGEQSSQRHFSGQIDEVRIYGNVRTADYIKLSFESQKADQAFIAPLQAPVLAYAPDSVTWYEDYATPVAPLVPMVAGVPAPVLSISPALPAGMTFNTTTGVISGAPTQNVTNVFVITATNSQGTARDTVRVFIHDNETFTAWTGTRALAVDGQAAGLAGAVARYPLLVRLGAADSAVFTGAGPGAAALRFTNAAGLPLHHEIENWDSAGRKAVVWVLMDSIRATGITTLNVRYGNAAATSRSNGSAVFDAGGGFMGAWHMGTASGAAPRINSVSPGMNDATPRGSDLAGGFVPRPGIVGMADTLRRVDDTQPNDDHFDLDTGFADFNGQVSMSMWIRPVVGSGQTYTQYLTVSTGDASNNIWFGRVDVTNNLGFEVYNGSAGGTRHDATGAITQGEWQYFTVTMNGLEKRIYKNGALVGGPFTSTQPIPNVLRTENHIGRSPWPDENLHGMVDEVRIANLARSADWVKLDYASQRPGAGPVAGLSYPVISGAPGVAITPVNPTLASGTAMKWSVTPALPAGIVLDSMTGSISGTTASTGGGTYTVKAAAGAWSASATVNVVIAIPDGAYSSWSGHKYVIANTQAANGGASVSDTVSRFPMLVRLGTADAAIFAASQKNGADIRFTKNDNATRLAHEIEHWDSAGKSAAIWVLVDTVRGNVNNNAFRLHWGKAGVADSSKPWAVFDSSRYLGVWHMGNVAGNTEPRPNAVAGGFPATPAASSGNLTSGFFPVTGVIGLADTLRSSSATVTTADHFNLGTSGYVFTGGQVTMSMWVWLPTAFPSNSYVHFLTFGNGTNNADNIWMGRIGTSNTFAQRSATSTGESTQMEVSDGLLPLGEWANYTITRAGTNGQVATSYKNGAVIFGPTAPGDATLDINPSSRTLNYIGRSIWGDRNLRGNVDEVRVLKTARSAGWVKLEYANQKPGATMVSLADAIPPYVTPPVGLNSAYFTETDLSVRTAGTGLNFRIQSPEVANARLSVIDMRGNVIWSRALKAPVGATEVSWDGTTRNGGMLGSGIYVVRMALLDEAGKQAHTLQRRIPLTR